MSKEQDEIRAEIFQGEPICGDCSWCRPDEDLKNCYYCYNPDSSENGWIINEDEICCDPSRFSPSHGSAMGETIETKDVEE